jgi:hypothetical protein
MRKLKYFLSLQKSFEALQVLATVTTKLNDELLKQQNKSDLYYE